MPIEPPECCGVCETYSQCVRASDPAAAAEIVDVPPSDAVSTTE